MPRPMLLFDIDGTLVDTGGTGLETLERTAQRLFGGRLTYRGIDAAGRLDASLFAEAAKRSGFTPGPEDHDQLRDAYVVELQQAMLRHADRVRALPGAVELIRRLSGVLASSNGDGPVLGCLTGNYGSAAQVKLHATGFDPGVFTVTAFGDEAQTRPGLTALALARYEEAYGHAADPSRVYVIGDTPHDIDCAAAHGCIAVAVATGRYDLAHLRAAGADLVLPDLCYHEAVLDLIGAAI